MFTYVVAKLASPPSRYLLKPQSLLDRLRGNLLALSATQLSHCFGVCLPRCLVLMCVCVAGGKGTGCRACVWEASSMGYFKEWIVSNNLVLR